MRDGIELNGICAENSGSVAAASTRARVESGGCSGGIQPEGKKGSHAYGVYGNAHTHTHHATSETQLCMRFPLTIIVALLTIGIASTITNADDLGNDAGGTAPCSVIFENDKFHNNN